MSEKKFYQMTPDERLAALIHEKKISAEDAEILSGKKGLSLESANFMIENVIGTFALPLGVARGFLIDGKRYNVPMVIEEPSVVAAASNAAKITAQNGGFQTCVSDPIMTGEIQLMGLSDLEAAARAIRGHKAEIASAIDTLNPALTAAGGGFSDLDVKPFHDTPAGSFLVIYISLNVADAMGANAINSALEHVTPMIEGWTQGTARLRILTNLADRRLAKAQCELRPETLAAAGFSGEEVRDRILDGAALAEVDVYRAVTHNKGIFNGIDAVLIACGNDWRAVEAGGHGYAATGGAIHPLTRWGKDEAGNLLGMIELPMAVGIIGGATRVHPAAQAALRLMGITSARELASILAAVGLAQNLAALRALSTVGIQKGHMALHARQVAIAAGAGPSQIESIAEALRAAKNITTDYAKEILSRYETAQD